jgi:3-deoxy-D-manno-octulosonic-acid transferase
MERKLAAVAALFLYDLAWGAAIPFLKYSPRLVDGLTQRLARQESLLQADIWIHGSSAGESYLTAEIAKQLLSQGLLKLRLTSYTRQGIDILEKIRATLQAETPELEVDVGFIPFDKPAIMARTAAVVRPRLAVLVELELWPGMLAALKKTGSRVIIVNGRLTEKSLRRFLLFPSFWQSLAPVEVMAISEDDAGRFRRLFPGIPVSLVNNMKFDRLGQQADAAMENPLAALLDQTRPTVVLASVRQEEEEQIERIIEKLLQENPQIRVLLFPRHMDRIAAWKKRLDSRGLQWRLRSGLGRTPFDGQVVLWDRFGELGHAYALARAAFVGGSLAPLGGQNFLEPVDAGLVPVTGPSWENFAWVGEEIVRAGLLFVETGWEKAAERLLAQVADPRPREEVRREARDFLEKKRGGTRITCERILAILRDTSQEKGA